jgi:hypothetical protein
MKAGSAWKPFDKEISLTTNEHLTIKSQESVLSIQCHEKLRIESDGPKVPTDRKQNQT